MYILSNVKYLKLQTNLKVSQNETQDSFEDVLEEKVRMDASKLLRWNETPQKIFWRRKLGERRKK